MSNDNFVSEHRHRAVIMMIAAVALFSLLFSIIALSAPVSGDDTPHTVTFNANGGTIEKDGAVTATPYSTEMYQSLYIPGNEFTIEISSVLNDYLYSRSNYTFQGWSTSPTATEPEYTEGNVARASDLSESNYNLYAVWKAIPYPAVFHYSGGDVTVSIPYGSTFDTSSYVDAYTPQSMSAYKVVGWSTIQLTDKVGDAYIIPNTARTMPYEVKMETEGMELWPIYALKVNLANQSRTINNNGCYYIYAAGTVASYNITVSGGHPYVYISDLNIDLTNRTSQPFSPINVNNGATLELINMGNSNLTGASNVASGNYRLGYAGIYVQTGGTLIISANSTGTLTVTGGSATVSSLGWFEGRYANAGAGIGANGAATGSGSNTGCGTIIINGGTVDAKGGTVLSTSLIGLIENTDLTSGTGIGGNGADIAINGGTVIATSGQVYRESGAWSDDTIYSKGGSYDPIYTNDGTPSISPDANVILNGRTDSEIVAEADGYVVLTFTSNLTIEHVTTVTIGEYSVNVGDMTIIQNSKLKLAKELFQNSEGAYYTPKITVLTTGGAYYSCTSQKVSEPGTGVDGKYNAPLTADTRTYHGTVSVCTGDPNETTPSVLVNGTGTFGSISTYGNFSITGNSATSGSFDFEIVVEAGYELKGIYKKAGNGGWTSVPFTWPAGSSTYVFSTTFTMSTGSGTENIITFDFQRTTRTVTINNNIAKGTTEFPSTVIGNNDSPALAPVVMNDYSVLTQTVNYGDSRTYTINLFNDSVRGNPVHFYMLTVRGAIVVPEVVNSTTLRFTVDDIETDVEINIIYKLTSKITANQTSYLDGSTTVPVAVTIVDESGNPVPGLIWYPDQSNPDYCYTYVEIGETVYFSISGYDPINFGVGSVRVTFYNDAHLEINTTVIGTTANDMYTIPNLIHDTEVKVTMTGVVYDVEFSSTVDDVTTLRLIRVAEGTVITLPTVAEFPSLLMYKDGSGYHTAGSGLPVKAGYAMTQWIVLDGSGNPTSVTYGAGSQISITSDMVLMANWSAEPIYYSINYDLGGGNWVSEHQMDDYLRFDNLIEDISIYFKKPNEADPETSAVIMAGPVRTGYVFMGWTGFGITGTSQQIDIPCSTTTEDVYFTAVWQPISVHVTFYDPQKDATIGDHYYDYGAGYTGLPICSNFTDDGVSYTFAGWALSFDAEHMEYGEKITSSTRITNADDHVIYVIWSPSNICIINITTDMNRGTVTASPSIGPAGTHIVITVTPNSGYTATELWKDGAQQSFSGGVSTSTFEFDVPSSDVPAIITIRVVFECLDYTITVHHVNEDGENVTVRHYNVESESIYITRAEVGTYPDHTFVGWTGTGITGTETNYVLIATGSTGDKEYFEVWHKIVYTITYELNGGTNSPQNPSQYTTGFVVVLGDPTYGTYRFDGWYLNSDFSGNQISEISANTEGDLILYAKWLFIIVEFDANGGIGETMTPLDGRTGDSVLLPACTYTYDGRLFFKWNTEANGSGTYYEPGQNYTMPAESTTLYAIWHIMVDKASVTLQSRTYDGTTLTQENGTGYTLSGQVSGKYYGTYTVDAKLKAGYVWSDGTYDDLSDQTWNIYKRTAFIVANSVSMRQRSSSTDVPFSADYYTIGIISSDFEISTSCTLDRNTANEYINRVTCAVSSELTEDAVLVFASYNLTIIDGNAVVYDSDSSTVTVVFKNGPTASSMGMPAGEGKMITVIPRIVGRRGI